MLLDMSLASRVLSWSTSCPGSSDGAKTRKTVSRTSALLLLPLAQDNPHDTAPLDPSLLDVPYSARHAPGAPHLAPADSFLHANGQPSWQLLHFLRSVRGGAAVHSGEARSTRGEARSARDWAEGGALVAPLGRKWVARGGGEDNR